VDEANEHWHHEKLRASHLKARAMDASKRLLKLQEAAEGLQRHVRHDCADCCAAAAATEMAFGLRVSETMDLISETSVARSNSC